MTESPRVERIRAAARRRFESQGFRHSSVAEIAEDAGVAAGTLYWHFGSKEELLLELIDADNQAWLEQARDVLSQPGSALERLSRLARASAGFYAKSKLLLAVLRRDRSIIHPPLLEDNHTRLLKQNVSLMAEVIQQGIDEGSVRPVDAEKAAYVLFCAGHAFFSQTDHPYEELAAVLADVATHGLAVPSGPG